ncbi:preprotein translocase subunit YajC [Luteolibacter ambystomatis]|uniref:Sec translocon accessory complex subunit YajC n=1 Tax=Luteolibacter ambystomatis TaxID=2824561 RepID=A0A975IZF7_9BACT|nr:preprotein translocase subunit YajC [Luteolibacter ambystomatis]QUE51421.1 preprotein translocase subunit YajC [Luteolibacter ambystomatis]
MTLLTAFVSFLAADAPASGQNPLGSAWIMPVVILVMMYFLLIRPQQQQRKEQQARIASLQPGAKVVTTAGIYAIVHSVKEQTVVLKVAEGTMVEFDKQAVARIFPKDTDKK